VYCGCGDPEEFQQDPQVAKSFLEGVSNVFKCPREYIEVGLGLQAQAKLGWREALPWWHKIWEWFFRQYHAKSSLDGPRPTGLWADPERRDLVEMRHRAEEGPRGQIEQNVFWKMTIPSDDYTTPMDDFLPTSRLPATVGELQRVVYSRLAGRSLTDKYQLRVLGVKLQDDKPQAMQPLQLTAIAFGFALLVDYSLEFLGLQKDAEKLVAETEPVRRRKEAKQKRRQEAHAEAERHKALHHLAEKRVEDAKAAALSHETAEAARRTTEDANRKFEAEEQRWKMGMALDKEMWRQQMDTLKMEAEAASAKAHGHDDGHHDAEGGYHEDSRHSYGHYGGDHAKTSRGGSHHQVPSRGQGGGHKAGHHSRAVRMHGIDNFGTLPLPGREVGVFLGTFWGCERIRADMFFRACIPCVSVTPPHLAAKEGGGAGPGWRNTTFVLYGESLQGVLSCLAAEYVNAYKEATLESAAGWIQEHLTGHLGRALRSLAARGEDWLLPGTTGASVAAPVPAAAA